MYAEEYKLHITRLNEIHGGEQKLIASGLILQTLSAQITHVCEVELAIALGIGVGAIRSALHELEKDDLVERNFRGEWTVSF